MNFKRFYINGNRFSFQILYRTKIYRFNFDGKWNGLMSFLHLFTTKRYVIKEENDYFSIYYKYYFTERLIEKWKDKQKAKQKIHELFDSRVLFDNRKLKLKG